MISPIYFILNVMLFLPPNTTVVRQINLPIEQFSVLSQCHQLQREFIQKFYELKIDGRLITDCNIKYIQ